MMIVQLITQMRLYRSMMMTRIIYLKNEKNSGAAVSRNKALRNAKGKWIAFLDSDDLWYARLSWKNK